MLAEGLRGAPAPESVPGVLSAAAPVPIRSPTRRDSSRTPMICCSSTPPLDEGENSRIPGGFRRPDRLRQKLRRCRGFGGGGRPTTAGTAARRIPLSEDDPASVTAP